MPLLVLLGTLDNMVDNQRVLSHVVCGYGGPIRAVQLESEHCLDLWAVARKIGRAARVSPGETDLRLASRLDRGFPGR